MTNIILIILMVILVIYLFNKIVNSSLKKNLVKGGFSKAMSALIEEIHIDIENIAPTIKSSNMLNFISKVNISIGEDFINKIELLYTNNKVTIVDRAIIKYLNSNDYVLTTANDKSIIVIVYLLADEYNNAIFLMPVIVKIKHNSKINNSNIILNDIYRVENTCLESLSDNELLTNCSLFNSKDTHINFAFIRDNIVKIELINNGKIYDYKFYAKGIKEVDNE